MEYVEFAGLRFEFGLRPPSWEGYSVKPGGFSGWDDSAGVRRDSVARPSAHGSFRSQGTLGDRLPSLEGHIIAHSESALESLIDALNALPVSSYAQYRVVSHANSRWSWGTLNSVKVKRLPSNGEVLQATFMLEVWCPDPEKFGDEVPTLVHAGQSADLVNKGTVESWARAVVYGPVNTGWSLLGFTVNRAVATGETVSIDSATGSVVSSSAGELMGQVTGYPVPVPVGTSVASFDASGSGRAELLLTETFF